jgi:hypothetical protein
VRTRLEALVAQVAPELLAKQHLDIGLIVNYLRAVRSRWSRLDQQGQAEKSTPSDIFKRALGKWW